jgi:hypothetical protein
LKPTLIAADEELGIDWERMADGRAWRLKRRRDYPRDVQPRAVREAANNAARRMGKVVQTLADGRDVWVQFSDHKIRLGDPCPCGNRRLHRVHALFVHCDGCGAQLELERSSVFSPDDGADPTETEREAEVTLAELTDVRLDRIDGSGDRDLYRGYGRNGDQAVFVLVEFRVEPGEQLTADEAPDRATSVQAIPFEHLDGLADADSLLTRPESAWDLLL